ncbi:hypothetical protein CALVIDRAFT_565212 [Calocera viscosa TUFC12733]|uniref:Uncharacterized protein n=1 Tax=Calocera viscosa (strain TUFC12733) TaxID=1330018 RepID=A0A167KMJ9_CALVF|nr:hypothetical protein CALVIDRAFT_565212 [Calocera viscosa TUFC12733]
MAQGVRYPPVNVMNPTVVRTLLNIGTKRLIATTPETIVREFWRQHVNQYHIPLIVHRGAVQQTQSESCIQLVDVLLYNQWDKDRFEACVRRRFEGRLSLVEGSSPIKLENGEWALLPNEHPPSFNVVHKVKEVGSTSGRSTNKSIRPAGGKVVHAHAPTTVTLINHSSRGDILPPAGSGLIAGISPSASIPHITPSTRAKIKAFNVTPMTREAYFRAHELQSQAENRRKKKEEGLMSVQKAIKAIHQTGVQHAQKIVRWEFLSLRVKLRRFGLECRAIDTVLSIALCMVQLGSTNKVSIMKELAKGNHGMAVDRMDVEEVDRTLAWEIDEMSSHEPATGLSSISTLFMEMPAEKNPWLGAIMKIDKKTKMRDDDDKWPGVRDRHYRSHIDNLEASRSIRDYRPYRPRYRRPTLS